VWAVPERLCDRVIAIYDEAFEMPRLHPGAGAIRLGRFTEDGYVTLTHGGRTVGTVKAADLTEGIAYERKSEAPRRPVPPPPRGGEGPDLATCVGRFETMLSHPDGASRAYVFRHYDPEVGGRTVLRPGEADACVIAPIPGSPAGLAVAVDGNPHRGLVDPYQAGAWAVVGAVRNVAAVGARPIALSDCLNFGNPEVAEVFHGFKEAVRGIAETADALGLVDDPSVGLPVVTGNVSFYNQSVRGQAIPPSPIVGCVGAVDDIHRVVDASVKTPGHHLLWAGRLDPRLGGTLYARVAGIESTYPEVDTALERALIQGLHDVISRGLVHASHDVSEGGLLTALVEMCTPFGEAATRGLSVDLGALPGSPDPEVALFSEAGAVLLEVAPDQVSTVSEAFTRRGASAVVVGEVRADPVLTLSAPGAKTVTLDLARMSAISEGGLARWLA
jgi:phosphoribosylformylglycinamidine synthase